MIMSTKKAAVRKSVAKKPVKKAITKSNRKITKSDEPSKADVAREIFKLMAGKSRKEIIAAFISDAGLTPAGAATYFINIKRESSK